MIKNFTKLFILVFIAALFAGCATKNYQVRSYIQDKERVDQDLSSGNQGVIQGTAKPEDTDRKKTRQVYVLEVTKKTDELPDEYYGLKPSETNTGAYKVQESPVVSQPEPRKKYQPESKIIIPPIEETTGEKPAAKETTYTNYIVEKDDTLQKISKKFYGTFGKWTKIYEANKEKIKNPDRIQPGIEIRIPQ